MIVPKPEPVQLTEEERRLLARVQFDPQQYSEDSAAAAVALTRSLVSRGAIPEVRLRYLRDPEFNIGGRGKSRLDVFRLNGLSGDDIIAHPHFLKYLKYLIFGPDLPEETIEGFRQILIDDMGTSGELLDQLRRYVRAEVRRLHMDRDKAREEFFKLALECGLDLYFAESIRRAAGTA